MEKIEARKVICRFAKLCLARGISQSEWESFEGIHHPSIPRDVTKARQLVPEIWEHVGYWVWQPIRRDR